MADQVKTEPSVEPEPATTGELAGEDKRGLRSRQRIRRSTASHAGWGLFQPLPVWIWFVAAGLAIPAAFSADPGLTPAGILMIPILASLLWLRGEPPVLLFACCMQWVQATAALFYTKFYGVSLEGAFGGPPELVPATWLSMIGIVVLAVGMRLALVGCKSDVAREAEQEARLIKPASVFILYLIAFVVFYFVGQVGSRTPALRQPLLAAATLKWVLVFLLAYSVLSQRRHYALLAVVVALEFVTGVLGYFASFKNIFFVLLVVLPTARFLFRGARLVQFSLLAVVLVVVGIVWTVIKAEYREFLNQGSGRQEIVVPVPDRLAKLNELLRDLDRDAITDGLETMIMRLSYVNFFAFSIINVPENIPYEKGALWFGAIKHVLTPRFLFPNKPAINDSERTSYYSGVVVAGEEQGTSISIGYMGESYIDFGPRWMFAPVFLLGLFYGGIYRYFVHHQRHRVLGFAMASAILTFGAYTIETSNIKLVGGNLMSLIVIGLFTKFAGEWLWRTITKTDAAFPGRRPRRAKTGGRR